MSGVATAGGGAGGATIMQHGVAGTYNVLALGAQGNKVAYVNGNTSRFGIGTDNPAAPLGFAATAGKKIALYPGVTNDYGLGIAAGGLQIYSDGTPSGDVAIGTDAAGTFTERFAVKNTGALAVLGNSGAAGQVLQSNGSGAPATWVSPTGLREREHLLRHLHEQHHAGVWHGLRISVPISRGPSAWGAAQRSW